MEKAPGANVPISMIYFTHVSLIDITDPTSNPLINLVAILSALSNCLCS